MNLHRKILFELILILGTACGLFCQTIKSMEFCDKEIRDILLVLGSETGKSIVADETVSGKTSFYFGESTFEEAIRNFISNVRLFAKEENGVIRVSRIFCETDSLKTKVTLKANDASAAEILKRLQSEIGTTILWDNLPEEKLCVNIADCSPVDAVRIVIKKFEAYEIEENENCFYVRKSSEKNTGARQIGKEKIKRDGDFYTIEIERDNFKNVISDFMSKAGKEYSLFTESNRDIEKLYFYDKTFEQALKILLDQGNADFALSDGIYCILDVNKRLQTSRLKETFVIKPKWISVQDAVSMMPQDYGITGIRIDAKNNTGVFIGTKEEIEVVRKFIGMIDAKDDSTAWKKIELKFLEPKEAISLVQKKFPVPALTVLEIPGTNSIIASGTIENIKEAENFVQQIDKKNSGVGVKLRYISAEELMKNLPPSCVENKSLLIETGFSNLVFWAGTDEMLGTFRKELELIDVPKPQIKYQLLVVQYTKGNSVGVKPTLGFMKENEDESGFIFEGDFSNLMALSFDVLSLFGYQFAATLNARISENTANVFTDTTLTGLAGQEVKFQNTETYRYMEYDYDKSSGTSTSSSTQQITSGLIFSVEGNISGDNMITMKINATVSKQNSENSSASNSSTLPSTSERIVSTEVRTKSGEPIVISGLIKEEESESASRIPLISKIPFVGKFFQHKSKAKDKTEIVLYMVPRLMTENSCGDKFEKYYKELVAND